MLQPAEYGGAEAHPREFAETVMRLASLDGSTRLGRRHRRRPPVGDGAVRPARAGGDLGRGPGDLDRLAVRTDGRAAAGRRRLRLQRALAVLLRHRPLRLDLPRRVPRRRGRSGRAAAAELPRDPAALRLRDRRGHLGRRRPARHGQQGRHRQGRVHPVVPGGPVLTDDGRLRAAGVRAAPTRRTACPSPRSSRSASPRR